MITGKDVSRAPLAQVAIRCFLEQTYLEKELIVINDGAQLLEPDVDPRIKEVLVRSSRRSTLGELRNIGLDAARGALVIQWDDDDWHHPQRMEVQVAHWSKGSAVLLKRQVRYSICSKTARIYENSGGIHGTILHERVEGFRYLPISKQEDSLFLRQFSSVVVVDAPARMYLRLFHGGNTWDEYHVMGNLADPSNKGRCDMGNDEKETMLSTLSKYYRENPRME